MLLIINGDQGHGEFGRDVLTLDLDRLAEQSAAFGDFAVALVF